jgi:hypothetical protein
VVFTDRASYTYSKVKYTPDKTYSLSNLQLDTTLSPTDYYHVDGYVWFKQSGTSASSADIRVNIPNAPFTKLKMRLKLIDDP